MESLLNDINITNLHGNRRDRRNLQSKDPVLGPLLSWVNDIPLKGLQQIVKAASSYWLDELNACASVVPNLEEASATSELLQLWTLHLMPTIVMQVLAAH